MMLKLSDINTLLKQFLPEVSIYNGLIDYTKTQCIGLFTRPSAPVVAIGGIENSSYNSFNVSILVHWGEDTDVCESIADSIYNFLYCKTNVTVNAKNIRFVNMEHGGPIDISRDERNICEMVIHANFYYAR